MQKIKQLNSLIDQTCSDTHSEPPVKLYSNILTIIQSRVDMPKHIITAISKKLSSKSKKLLYICFDLLQFLSYNLQLSFFSQIATKQFLFKISGLMMGKDIDPVILDKILKLIKCFDQLFRPLEDLLPLFFQFQAGLLRKQFQIPYQYVSPYRPKQLKQYKKIQKKQQNISKKPIIQASKTEQKTFQEIRMKILITNQIIDNCDPAGNVKSNDLLIQMIQQLKGCQKKINQSINQNPSEQIMQLALATNDDLYITYRRFKDLQRNKKPQPFIFSQLPSDLLKEKQKQKQTKNLKTNVYRTQAKVQPKPQIKNQSIFDLMDEPQQAPVKKTQSPQKLNPKKVQNIFDLDLTSNQPVKVSDPFNLIDVIETQNITSPSLNNSQSIDFLGLSNSMSSNKVENNSNSVIGDIFSLNLNNNNKTNLIQTTNQNNYLNSMNPMLLTNYRQSNDINQMPVFNYQTSSPIYSGIQISLSEQPKKIQQPIDKQKAITDMNDFQQFLTSNQNK